ncbi:unnamed protein product (macronuclear) [Paramecium tetraurelia]|uniref:Uncharacterized protein n=1 Tax=Paramecium tetraurelia TaxID=5888 RepID=A0DW32_PARTE|nr:uncharacterized protein GSPATT00020902001 [Paramecium tetraurelia]CAK87249.1 unnamed protein product [Paramecium tetraurelia]|eukprot:XP_001454646.1 hypothetical protein (macronuclear) [Paramecium tetraurelia strain d4-2]
MFNPLNRARSPQYNGYPNQANPNSQFGGNPYPFMGQQSPVNQPLTQRSFPQQQYPQNTPPKGYPLQQSQRSNPPFAQQQQYPPNQPSVQSIQPPPQSQPPQQAPQTNYVQPPQRSQKPMAPQSIEQQKLPTPQINLQAQPQQYVPSQSSALGLSGLRQTYTPPTFVPLQPVMTTVIQRPIEFVDLEKFEELWDKRMKELEDRIRQSQPQPQVVELRSSNDEDKDALIKQLQDELYKVRCDNEEKDNKISDLKIELQTNVDLVEYLRQQLVNSNNSDEVEKLQNEIQRLRKQVQTLDAQVKQLNHDNADLKQELEALRQQKQFFKSQCDDKDEHIQNLEREIEELRQQVDTLTEEVTTSQSVKTYEEEAKIWRSKFKELNDTYHACQEKLILTEAELDLLKRPQSQQKIVTTSTTVVKNNVQTSGTKSDSDYLSSSLTQQDVERIQNLSKNIPQI